jgi:hypothetical protein
MKQFRSKPHSGRSRSDSGYDHWLGEGVQGQETLLDDLDPTLYLVDSVISSLITSTALGADRRDRRPQAILVPAEGSLGWHVGALAKRFEVAVWTAEDDELISETAYHFNARTFTGDLGEGADDGSELVLFTAYSWPSETEFRQALDEALDTLTENGAAILVLPLEQSPSGPQIRWTGSAATPLAELTNPETDRDTPRSFEVFWFKGFNPKESEVLGGFLKRHRDYFGKNVRELTLDRLSSPEFQLESSPFGAAVLVYATSE